MRTLLLAALDGTAVGRARVKAMRMKRRKSVRDIVCGHFLHCVSEISKACKHFSHGTKNTVGEYSIGGAMKNRGLATVSIAMDTVDFETADMASMMRS